MTAPMPRSLQPLAALLLLAVPAACAPRVQAPADPGVCWHMVLPKGGKPVYNKVAEGRPNLESCAANLEAMRVRFLSLGGSRTNIYGAYQGTFIFINRDGVYASEKLDGTPYLALVRTGDGRLAVPGAVAPQS